MLIDIVVGTFGSKDWEDKNADLCHRMSTLPGVNNIISVHADSLAKARNRGAKMSNADYVIFLDADDFLDSEYVNSMHDATDLFQGPMAVHGRGGVYRLPFRRREEPDGTDPGHENAKHRRNGFNG